MSLIFLITLMFVMLILYFVTEDLFYDNAKESAFSISNSIYVALDDNIFSVTDLTTQVGNDPFIAENFFSDESSKEREIQQYIFNIRQIYQYNFVRVASFQTDYYYSEQGICNSFNEANPQDQWYFDIKSKSDQQNGYIPLVIKNDDHIYFYNIHIIHDTNGDARGFFLIALDYGDALQAIVKTVNALDANIYMIDRNGQLDTTFFQTISNTSQALPVQLEDLQIGDLLSENQQFIQTTHANISITLKYINELDRYLIITQDLSSHIYYTFILIFLGISLLLLIILLVVLRLIDYSNKKFQTEASLDPLTQIYNRSIYNSKLVESLELCQHYGIISSLIILDIDNFKSINDERGHQVGDEILIKIATLLNDCKRKHDILFRWGGDEFVIIARSHLKPSMLLTNRILTGASQIFWKENTPVTLSIGVTELKQDDTKKTVFERADQALYLAKNNGKNQAHQL